jgi:hypothetical protein
MLSPSCPQQYVNRYLFLSGHFLGGTTDKTLIVMGKPLIIKLLSTVVLLLLSFSVVSVLTPYGASTSPDSLSYLDIAANLRNGEGILTTDLSLKNQGRHLLTEQRSWPPLYPVVLAAFVSDYKDVLAAVNVSIILLFVGLLLVFKIISSQTEWYVALILGSSAKSVGDHRFR